MNWKELIRVFLPAGHEEIDKAFDECRSELDKICHLLRPLAGPHGDALHDGQSAELSDGIHNFTWSSLTQVELKMPFWRRGKVRDLRERISGILNEVVALVESQIVLPDANARFGVAFASLASAQAELSFLRSQALLSASLLQRLLNTTLILSALATILFFVVKAFVGWQIGIEHVGSEVVFPDQFGKPGEAGQFDLDSSPRDESRFLAEFAAHYYGLKLTDLALTRPLSHGENQKSKHPVSQRWKFLLRNRSRFTSEFISTLRVQVKLVERNAFPWKKMPIDPELQVEELESPSGALAIVNGGYGPAVRMRWAVRTNKTDIPLGEGEQWMMLEDLVLDLPKAANKATSFRLSGGKIPNHYLRLPKKPGKQDEKNSFKHGDDWYKTISSLGRLREEAKTASNEEYKLQINYEGIDGRSMLLQHVGMLPDGLLFVHDDGKVLASDPRQERSVPPPGSTGTNRGSRIWGSLAAISSAPIRPTGADAVREYFLFDLADVKEQQAHVRVASVDRFLGPNGYVSIYLDCQNPPTGTFVVTIYANDLEVKTLKVHCIHPESTVFPRASEPLARWRDINRLRKLFGAELVPKPDPLSPLLPLRPQAIEPPAGQRQND